MKKITWKKSMSVGNETLDMQHREIIEHFNKINALLSSRKGVDLGRVRQTMHFVYQYIKDHFAYEEVCMKKAKLKGFESHVRIHKNLIRIFDDFVKDFHDVYTEKYISSLKLSKLLAQFEHDVVEKYIAYMVKELDHLKKNREKLAAC